MRPVMRDFSSIFVMKRKSLNVQYSNENFTLKIDALYKDKVY